MLVVQHCGDRVPLLLASHALTPRRHPAVLVCVLYIGCGAGCDWLPYSTGLVFYYRLLTCWGAALW